VAAEEGFILESGGEDFARREEIVVGCFADGHGDCVSVDYDGSWYGRLKQIFLCSQPQRRMTV
jgi:hypothetical protein